MKIKSVKTKNFAVLGDSFFEFPDKVVTIVGDNGRGKSTILKAIAMAFGSKLSRYSDYVPFGSKNNSYAIEVCGVHEDKEVKLSLSYNGSATKREMLFGQNSYSGADVDVVLSKMFDSDVSSKTNFGVASVIDITKATPSELRKHLEQLLAVDYSTAVESIDGLLRMKRDEASRLEGQLQVLASRKFEVVEIPPAAYDETDLTSTARYLQETNEARNHLKRVSEVVHLLDQKQQSLQGEVVQMNELERAVLTEEQMATVERDLSDFERDIALLHKTVRDKSQQLGTSTAQLKSLKDAVAKVEEERINLYRMEECPCCFQKVDASHKGFLNTFFNDKIATMASDAPYLDKQIAQLQGELERVEEQLRLKERSRKAAEQQQQQQIKAQSALSAGKVAVQRLEIEVSSLQEELATLNEQTVSSSKEELDQREAQLLKLQQEIHESMAARKAALEVHRRVKAEELEVKEALKATRESLATLTDDLEAYKIAKEIFAKKLPTKVLTSTLSRLQKWVNNLIQAVYSKELSVVFSETSSGIEVSYSAEGQASFLHSSNASGFEQQLLNVAFRVATAALSKLGILVLDEPDSQASSTNSENLFSYLVQYLQTKEAIQQMFFVTHKEQTVELLSHGPATIITL